MQSPEFALVSLGEIPELPYDTPSDNVPALYAAAKRMEGLCREKKGMGLAAAQVGLPWRMFIACSDYPSSDEFQFFFDCKYEPVGEEKFLSLEGCLSIPGERYRVERYARVLVEGFMIVEGVDGVSAVPFSKVFSDVSAVVMQHEIDHDMGRERMIDRIGSRVVLA